MSQFDLTIKNHRSCYKCKGMGQVHSFIPTDRSRNAPSFQKCKGCVGTGSIPYEAMLCEKCLGRGTIHDHMMTHTMNCKYCKECSACSSKGWVENPSRQETSDHMMSTFQQSKFQPFSLKELDTPYSPLKSLNETSKEPKSAVFGSKKAAPEDSLFSFLGAKLIGPPTVKNVTQAQPSYDFRPASPASSSKVRSQSLQRPGRMTPMMDHLDHFVAKFAAETGGNRAPRPMIMKGRI